MKALDEKWEEVGPKTLFYKESAKDALEVSKKIRDFYFGEKSIGLETREQILDLYTDRYFAGPVRFAGRKLAKHIPVYLYYFNHKPKMSALEVFGFPKEINQGEKL
jgi:carboxylesterase type B